MINGICFKIQNILLIDICRKSTIIIYKRADDNQLPAIKNNKGSVNDARKFIERIWFIY